MAAPALPKVTRTLVMVATYNERATIERLLTSVWDAADVDILVIDDSSPDGTGDIVDAIAARDRRLTVVHRASKSGVASAHILAFRHALSHGYASVVEMDADFSHPPEVLPQLIAAANLSGVAVGSRCVRAARIVGRAWHRNMLTKLGGLYARAVLGLRVRDCTAGYRCTTAAALREIDLDLLRSQGYGFQLELNWAWKRSGQRITEVPIVFRDRTEGSSKMTTGILLESLVMVLRLRFGRVACAARGPAAQPARNADAMVES